jgi:hypothetical protein
VPLLPSYSTPPVSPRRGFDICQRELLIPSSAAASVRRQSIYRPFSAFGGGRLLVVAPGVGGISISSASRSPKRFRKARAANGVMDNDFMLRGQTLDVLSESPRLRTFNEGIEGATMTSKMAASVRSPTQEAGNVQDRASPARDRGGPWRGLLVPLGLVQRLRGALWQRGHTECVPVRRSA